MRARTRRPAQFDSQLALASHGAQRELRASAGRLHVEKPGQMHDSAGANAGAEWTARTHWHEP